ncbi:hypothetical protein HIM_12182 [Hirsutella minnesotensis 3608]|uniref:Uncharacterized protein n=1 Tax=Hirsutella minnesotensis 3608 TaxID=1043627 RepID=A0A0F7ZIB6_9HYPO|nr:hypothetical protein HIM_12544 [Hirsutella minnesotensis 3608]KJZ68430.1 hypothetical protein HIM_12182 [Hirsutella minnesotensis 3608]
MKYRNSRNSGQLYPQGQPASILNRNISGSAKAPQLSNDIQATKGRYRLGQEAKDAWQIIGLDPNDKALFEGIEKLQEKFDTALRGMTSHALNVPPVRTIRLQSCWQILDREFLFPEQLSGKVDLLRENHDLPGRFDDVVKSIKHHQQSLLALATEEAMIDYIFQFADELADIGREMERIYGIKKSKKKPFFVPIKSLQPMNAPAEVDPSASPITGSVKQHMNEYEGESRGNRQIRTFRKCTWSYSSRLSDADLHVLIHSQMDAGTFPDPEISAAYHVSKHAPHMLLEDYLRQAQGLVEKYWCGEVNRRFSNPYWARDERSEWVKVVRCTQGRVCATFEGLIIWYHPS